MMNRGGLRPSPPPHMTPEETKRRIEQLLELRQQTTDAAVLAHIDDELRQLTAAAKTPAERAEKR